MIDDITTKLTGWVKERDRYLGGYCTFHPATAYARAVAALETLSCIPRDALPPLLERIASIEWTPPSAIAHVGIFLSAAINRSIHDQPASGQLYLDLTPINNSFSAFPLNYFLYRFRNAQATVKGNVGDYFLDHPQDSAVQLLGKAGDYACRRANNIHVDLREVGDYCGIDGKSGRITVQQAGSHFSCANHGMRNLAIKAGRRFAFRQDAGITTAHAEIGEEAACELRGGVVFIPEADRTTARRMQGGDVYILGRCHKDMGTGMTGGTLHALRFKFTHTVTRAKDVATVPPLDAAQGSTA